MENHTFNIEQEEAHSEFLLLTKLRNRAEELRLERLMIQNENENNGFYDDLFQDESSESEGESDDSSNKVNKSKKNEKSFKYFNSHESLELNNDLSINGNSKLKSQSWIKEEKNTEKVNTQSKKIVFLLF